MAKKTHEDGEQERVGGEIPGASVVGNGEATGAAQVVGEEPGETQAVVDHAVPKNPDRCIVVRTDSERSRAYCSVERGSVVEEEFRTNGTVPDGAEDLLKAFASIIAFNVGQEAQQRDIEVVRVKNADAGEQTAAALREAGFFVVEFSE